MPLEPEAAVFPLPPHRRSRAGMARQVTRKAASTQKVDKETADIIVAQGLIGGKPRQTLPINANVLGMIPWMFIPRRQYQDMDLTTLMPGAFSPQQLIDLLADAWPDMSLALWNFLRLGANTWHYEVRTPDNEQEDTEGKAILDTIIKKVNRTWGGIDNLLCQWVMSVVLEGACAGECVPNEAIDDVDDFISVQPWTIYFQRDITQAYVAFQWQPMLAAGNAFIVNPAAPGPAVGVLLNQNALNHGGFRMLNEITFAYVPLDPAIDDPYGRMAMASVIQLIAFDAQLMKDLRQWSHVNAFGRINVSVVAEMVEKMMPPAVRNDKLERIRFFDSYLKQVQSAYNQINADDTFIHYDNVAVSGIDSSGKTFEIDNLIRILERRIFRALKQLPVLMGSNEGTTETHGTVQYEIYVSGIRSIQRVVASLMERLLTVALRIHGRNSVVTFTFDAINAANRKDDAIADQLEIKNAAAKRDQGWITQDEASIAVTGSAAVAKGPDPDAMVAANQPDQGAGQTQAQAKQDETPAPEDKPADEDTASQPNEDEDAAAIEKSQDKASGNGNGRGGWTRKQRRAEQRALLTAYQDVLALAAQELPALGEQGQTFLQRGQRHVMPSHPPIMGTERDTFLATTRDQLAAYFAAVPVSRGVVEHLLQTPVRRTLMGKINKRNRSTVTATVLSGLFAEIPAFSRELEGLLLGIWGDGYDLAAQAALEQIGVRGTFSLWDQEIVQAIAVRVSGDVLAFMTAMREQVAAFIVAGIDERRDAAEVWSHLETAWATWCPQRAKIGATFLTAQIWGKAQLDTWGRNGIPAKRWLLGDGETAEACRANADAGVLLLADPFPSQTEAPPLFPDCTCRLAPVGEPNRFAPWRGEDRPDATNPDEGDPDRAMDEDLHVSPAARGPAGTLPDDTARSVSNGNHPDPVHTV